jgi:hypothetical protein
MIKNQKDPMKSKGYSKVEVEYLLRLMNKARS